MIRMQLRCTLYKTSKIIFEEVYSSLDVVQVELIVLITSGIQLHLNRITSAFNLTLFLCEILFCFFTFLVCNFRFKIAYRHRVFSTFG